MNDLLQVAAEEADAQVGELDGAPVAVVFLAFDANGRCSAGSAIVPEHLNMLVARVVEAAADVQAGLAGVIDAEEPAKARHLVDTLDAERITASAIQKARQH